MKRWLISKEKKSKGEVILIFQICLSCLSCIISFYLKQKQFPYSLIQNEKQKPPAMNVQTP